MAKKKLTIKDIEHITVRELAKKLKSVDRYVKNPKELSSAEERKPQLAFFLGAGASFESGIMLAGQMMKIFKEEIFDTHCPELKTDKEKDDWLKKQVWYKSGKDEYGCLFEKAFETKTERQRFIENMIADKEPSFGYVILADLLLRNYVNTVLTTNFDDLVYISSTTFTGNRPIVYAYGILASEMKILSNHSKVLKLHGDYLYSNIVNTSEEMYKQSQALKEPYKDIKEAISSLNMEHQVRTVLDNLGLVVIGYSGGDKTVMELLQEVSKDNGFYWCYVKGYPPDEDVLQLIIDKKGKLVEIEGFDSLMKEISDVTEFKIDDLLKSIDERKERLKEIYTKFNPEYTKESLNEYAEELKEDINDDMKDSLSAVDYSILGDYEYRKGDYSKAEKYYKEAIKINSNKAEYHYKIGVLLFHIKSRWQEAEDHFKKALEINKNKAIVKNCYGFLRYVQNREDEAIKLFQETIDMDEKLAFPYVNLSAIYKRRYEATNKISDKEAYEEYTQKAEKRLKEVDYYLQACLYSAKRNKDKTLDYLKKIVDIEPGKKISAKCSPTFDWIRNDPRFKEIVGDE